MKVQVLSPYQLKRIESLFLIAKVEHLGVLENGDVRIEFIDFDGTLKCRLIPRTMKEEETE
jgi:hypothetical protein